MEKNTFLFSSTSNENLAFSSITNVGKKNHRSISSTYDLITNKYYTYYIIVIANILKYHLCSNYLKIAIVIGLTDRVCDKKSRMLL